MQLAHPLYGIMMLDFRPVDCISRQALALVPGYISNTVYGDRVETGWAWFPYRQSAAQFWQGVRPLPGHPRNPTTGRASIPGILLASLL